MTTHESHDVEAALSTLAEAHPHAVQAIRNATDREAAETAFRGLLRAVYEAGHKDGLARPHHAPAHEAPKKK